MHNRSAEPTNVKTRLRRGGAVAALVVAMAFALPAGAQTGCAAGFANSRAEPPLLDAFTPLFRQNGVAFHARVETDPAAAGGRLVIRNGNTYDVEVTYDVVVSGSAAPVSAEGRCARIRAGEYAVDADANTVIAYDGGTPAAVRVRNLRMARVTDEAAAAPGAPPVARPAAASELAQYQCGEGGAPGQRACSTAFMAAAARAAADAGQFSGTTRECLLEYAALQEGAARLIRDADARGDSLRLTTPACYSRAEARWGYAALAAACPNGAWTAANAGRADCAAAARTAADSLPRDSAAALDAAGAARQRLATGLLLLDEGLDAQAEAEFRRALALTPADPELHAGLGMALARQNRRTEAEAALRAAVWLDPSNPRFASLLRGLRAPEAPAIVRPAAFRAERARTVGTPDVPARRIDVPILIATTIRLVFATALTAVGALLLVPVLSAMYLAVVWGATRVLALRVAGD
jgi:Flp pilus assembly protein TadD